MKILTSYDVKIKEYNSIFGDTVSVYRKAVDYLINVCVDNWDSIVSVVGPSNAKGMFVEHLVHGTAKNEAIYDFDKQFYKFPSYYRRAAISCAIGKVSSYMSNLANWEKNPAGGKPTKPKAGFVFPVLYKDGSFIRTSDYTANIKVYRNNTWDWLAVTFRKSDVDYITHHCLLRKGLSPTLKKKGKSFVLSFPFEEKVELYDTDISNTRILAVDLGVNNACTCCVMEPDGTILERKFLKLSREQDSLAHAINRIKKAQQHGARRTPRLWAKAKGINHQIAVKTAQFITETAVMYGCEAIVFEFLDLKGKKRGSKKQRLHMWKANAVQSIVSNKAHRAGIHIARVNAWNTSRLAFDGSGRVERDKDNYSMCTFVTGKRYHADLSASYNIGARYFIREIYKSLPETVRLLCEAEVPHISKRSTCTWNDLISLCAVLGA